MCCRGWRTCLLVDAIDVGGFANISFCGKILFALWINTGKSNEMCTYNLFLFFPYKCILSRSPNVPLYYYLPHIAVDIRFFFSFLFYALAHGFN